MVRLVGRLLVLDIGGGSMEIALGRDAQPELAISLPLGAGRLTRAFLPDDPPTDEQLTGLRRHVNSTLREVADRLRWEGTPGRVIATSKTFKQLARLTGAPPQRKGPFAHRSVTARDLGHWIPRLAGMPAKQRARLRGISQPRARQILAGAVVARAAMKALNVTKADVSPWALREGIILHYLQTRLSDSLILPLRPLDHLAGEDNSGAEAESAFAAYGDGERRVPSGARTAISRKAAVGSSRGA